MLGVALAGAAAALFLGGAVGTAMATEKAAAEPKQRCVGVNACQGKSECKTAEAEKGRNACKGQGVLFLTEKQCQKLGGKVEKS